MKSKKVILCTKTSVKVENDIKECPFIVFLDNNNDLSVLINGEHTFLFNALFINKYAVHARDIILSTKPKSTVIQPELSITISNSLKKLKDMQINHQLYNVNVDCTALLSKIA